MTVVTLLIGAGLVAAGFALGWIFGRTVSLGGPEHRDPTDQELKDAKEHYDSKYLNRPNDSLPPVFYTVDDE